MGFLLQTLTFAGEHLHEPLLVERLAQVIGRLAVGQELIAVVPAQTFWLDSPGIREFSPGSPPTRSRSR